jgi:hypothetical protein
MVGQNRQYREGKSQKERNPISGETIEKLIISESTAEFIRRSMRAARWTRDGILDYSYGVSDYILTDIRS